MSVRRVAVAALILAFLMGPVHAQQPGKVYRIGWLGTASGGVETDSHHCPIQGLPNWQAWVEGLREHGYIPGQNLLIECRWTEWRSERAFTLAWELVNLQPDLIVAYTGPNTQAVKEATRTIPIVMGGVADPVGWLVGTLAHPGGNVTGLASTAGGEIFGKQLELLKEAVPKASRVAVLRYLGSFMNIEAERGPAARALGLTLQHYEVRAPEELASAFAAMTKARAEALLGEFQPFFWVHRQRIAELAAQSRLPGMYSHRDIVEAGGLMSYAANEPAIYRRLSFYVDRILKGTKPADLPVEQPTKFDLIINLKTAKALRLTIPQSLLMRADEVVQ